MLEAAPEACLSFPNPLELPPWRVLIVRSQHEARVAELLESKADECYLPTYRSVRRWDDRRVTLDLALFPTYLCKIRLGRARPGARELRRPSDSELRQPARASSTKRKSVSLLKWSLRGARCSRVELRLCQKVRIPSVSLSGIEGVTRKFRGTLDRHSVCRDERRHTDSDH